MKRCNTCGFWQAKYNNCCCTKRCEDFKYFKPKQPEKPAEIEKSKLIYNVHDMDIEDSIKALHKTQLKLITLLSDAGIIKGEK